MTEKRVRTREHLADSMTCAICIWIAAWSQSHFFFFSRWCIFANVFLRYRLYPSTLIQPLGQGTTFISLAEKDKNWWLLDVFLRTRISYWALDLLLTRPIRPSGILTQFPNFNALAIELFDASMILISGQIRFSSCPHDDACLLFYLCCQFPSVNRTAKFVG